MTVNSQTSWAVEIISATAFCLSFLCQLTSVGQLQSFGLGSLHSWLMVHDCNHFQTSPEIGLILRDSYGIPSIKDILGKGVSKVLSEHNLLEELPEDLLNLIKKSVMLKKHSEENKQDKTAKRGTQLTESKINRLIKYYKKTNVLPNDWKYDQNRFKLVAE